MRSIVCQRLFFTLTLLATMSIICSESYARGRGGGGRSRAGGGHGGAGASSRLGNGSRPNGGVTKPGNRPGKSSDLSSGFAGKGQFQGMLEKQPGQLSDKLSQQNGQFQQNAQTKANQFQGGSQPFTASWYAQHPNAWQATHPNAGVAVVASTAAVAAWVGSGYYATTGSGDSNTTIIYQAAPEEAAPAETVATSPTPAATTSVVATTTPAANAEQWFPIGIYTLATTKDSPAVLMLQLVVDHQGTLRGVYYDSITDSSHNIVGTLDPRTQVAQWRLESSNQATFQTSLDELTQSAGTLQVVVSSGPQEWLLARVEN